MKIISLYNFDETKQNQIRSYGTYEYYKSINEAQIEDCDILIGNTKPELLKYGKNLKWVQLYSAGNDNYTEDDLPQDAVLTNASGTFGRTISEHLVLYTLALMRNMKHYVLKQEEHKWDPIHKTQLIYGSTFVILGTGDLGAHYASAIKALGGYTIGVRKRSRELVEGFDEMFTIDELDTLLPRADVVVMALPKHTSTNAVMGLKQLELMKEGSYLLNVGRGNAIDQDALIHVLEKNHFGGVHLDVYEEEPLDANSKLWDFDNVVLTPHVSGTFANKETHRLFEELVLDNLERFSSGEELRNIVDFKIGYRQ